MTQDNGASLRDRAFVPSASSQLVAVSPVPASIPSAVIEQVLSMGRVEWGATDEFTSDGHLRHLEQSLRLTREAFDYEDIPVRMHGLYLEGVDTVLCHTGTSPNSGANAQALAGAWNWLHGECLASAMSAEGQDPQGLGAQPASAVPQGDAQ
jgi:hypothetical protein